MQQKQESSLDRKEIAMRGFALSRNIKFLGLYNENVQENKNQSISYFEDFADSMEMSTDDFGKEGGHHYHYDSKIMSLIRDIRKGKTENAVFEARELMSYFAGTIDIKFPGYAVLMR